MLAKHWVTNMLMPSAQRWAYNLTIAAAGESLLYTADSFVYMAICDLEIKLISISFYLCFNYYFFCFFVKISTLQFLHCNVSP